MSYLYFPGCSLRSTGRPYEESTLAVFEALGAPLEELDDWNCCGATAYMSISELKAVALCARNLALAEKQVGTAEIVDLVVPCAACYLGLVKAQHYLIEHEDIRERVDAALESAGLRRHDHVRVRHPLDVIVNDIGIERLSERVTRPLAGLTVACYYGCQLIRPYAEFDNQYNPLTMDRLMRALGATTIAWPLKDRCCGGSLTGTVPEVGLRLSYIILNEAIRRGGNVVATACPLCQFNLECYQDEISRRFEHKTSVSVTYFTQLIGLALGLDEGRLGLKRLFVPLHLPARPAATAGGQHELVS